MEQDRPLVPQVLLGDAVPGKLDALVHAKPGKKYHHRVFIL